MNEIKDLDGEVWVNVIDYEGLYMVSNLGRIKSYPKKWNLNDKSRVFRDGKILKPSINKHGYYFVRLCKDGKVNNKTIHRLVWESFNGKTNLYVLHNVENNKFDNRLCNLHIGNCRQNTTEYFLSVKKTSKYVGVSFKKREKKWSSCIQINGKSIYIGLFNTELDAHLAYQNKLSELNNNTQ